VGGVPPSPQVQYKLSPRVSDTDIKALLAEASPARAMDHDVSRVLSRGLGYVCAYLAGELVGFVNVAWDGGAHAFLLDPAVRTDCRRRGIGVQLVRYAEQLAREGGAEWLHVDFEPGLERFYRKCGFRKSQAGLINLKAAASRNSG
jgi:GNAT superfamily N-acetyltransferase